MKKDFKFYTAEVTTADDETPNYTVTSGKDEEDAIDKVVDYYANKLYKTIIDIKLI